MGKQYTACQYLATTGAGIALGTGVQLFGVYRNSELAGTITLEDGGSTILTMSADKSIMFPTPIACTGALTMTSSAGDSFVVLFANR